MEKRLGSTLKQGYVNRITAMLNSGMIPPGNSNIIQRFLLGKTRPGEEIRTWKNKSWDGYGKKCCMVVETMSQKLVKSSDRNKTRDGRVQNNSKYQSDKRKNSNIPE